MKIKVGILGSRELCSKIIEWVLRKDDIDLVGVVAPTFNGWWNDNVRDVCKKYSIHCFDNIEELMQKSPDILFSINYWKIIEKNIIDLVPKGIVNIHHSYLLKYKGRYSTSWAIMNARKLNCWEHGTTLHYIDERLDEGKIIASYSCEIEESDTAESLFQKVENLAYKMFTDNFNFIVNGQISSFLEPAQETFFYDADSNKNLEIEYGSPLNDVYDFVRAWSFKDRPKPYFLMNGKKIFLTL